MQILLPRAASPWPGAIAVAALGCAFLSGCVVPSVHPLYRKGETVAVPGLQGCWTDPESGERWKFYQKPSGKAYTLIYMDTEVTEDGVITPGDKVPAAFIAHFVRIGPNLYMDTYPTALNSEASPGGLLENDLYCRHLAAFHLFARVRLDGDALEVAFLDLELMEEALEQGLVRIPHEFQENPEEPKDDESDGKRLILTGSTDQLREMVREHEDLLFPPDGAKLQRVMPPPRAAPAKGSATRVSHPAPPGTRSQPAARTSSSVTRASKR